jgi:hypothetical protein
MNDKELRQALEKLPVPAVNEEAKARALHRSLTALNHASHNETPEHRSSSWFGWKAISALALSGCVALAVWTGVVEKQRADDTATLCQLLRQMESTFQNQLSAVVMENGTARIVLDQDAKAPAGRPVLISIYVRNEKNPTKILTFGGRWIDFQSNGILVHAQVLETGSGAFILAGDQFVWDMRERKGPSGCRIEGKLL